MSVQIEFTSIAGLQILRDRAQEKIDQNDPVPVCFSPRGLVRLLDWVIPVLESIPPKHHLPTSPVVSARASQASIGSKPSTAPVTPSTAPNPTPRANPKRKRQNRPKQAPPDD